MSNKISIFRNLSSLIVVQLVNYILPLIVLPVIVRVIGPSNFGIINYVSTIIGYFVLLIGFSFELSAVRQVVSNYNNPIRVNYIFNRVLFAKIFLLIISVLLFLCLLFFIKGLRENKLLSFFTFLICISTVLDSTWFFTAKQHNHKAAIFSLIAKALLNVSLLYFIRRQEDYLYYPLIVSASQIFVTFIAFSWAIHHYKIRLFFPGIKALFNRIWEDKTLFFHSFSHTFYTTINIVVLGMLRSSLEVGYYTAAWKLIIIIQALLISPLGVVLFPVIGREFQKNKESGIVFIQKSLPILIFISALIGFLIISFGGKAVLALFGRDFYASIRILKVLSFLPMLIGINMLLGIQTMVNLKMDMKLFLISLFAACINLILSILLIYNLNAIGAAIAWFMSELFCTVAMYLVLKKNRVQLIKLKYFGMQAVKSYLLPAIDKMRRSR